MIRPELHQVEMNRAKFNKLFTHIEFRIHWVEEQFALTVASR